MSYCVLVSKSMQTTTEREDSASSKVSAMEHVKSCLTGEYCHNLSTEWFQIFEMLSFFSFLCIHSSNFMEGFDVDNENIAKHWFLAGKFQRV